MAFLREYSQSTNWNLLVIDIIMRYIYYIDLNKLIINLISTRTNFIFKWNKGYDE